MKKITILWIVAVCHPAPTYSETEKCKTYRESPNRYMTTICTNFNLAPGEQIIFERTDLHCIIFKNSSIPVLKSGIFANQKVLRDLRISDSKLCVVEKGAIPIGNKLEVLQLDGNCIREITNDILSDSSELKVLDLSRNNITKIYDKSFDDSTSLNTLMLSSNQLSLITDTTFSSLNALQQFDISKNQILSISKNAFLNLTRLEKLSVSNNDLQDAGFMLGISNTISHLDLSSNRITTIGSLFKRLRKLAHLDLSRNELQSIETDSFTDLINLQFLNLNNNKLKVLCVNCFVHLAALKHLFLSNNSLQEIDFNNFVELRQLETLTFERNEVAKTVSAFLLEKQFSSVKYITLNGNAWTCSSLEGIIQILVKRNVGFSSSYGLLNNETNVYGIPCSCDCLAQSSIQNEKQEMKMTVIGDTYCVSPLFLSLLFINTILLALLILFQVLKKFFKIKQIFVKHEADQGTKHDEYEVVNDLYSMR